MKRLLAAWLGWGLDEDAKAGRAVYRGLALLVDGAGPGLELHCSMSTARKLSAYLVATRGAGLNLNHRSWLLMDAGLNISLMLHPLVEVHATTQGGIGMAWGQ